MPPSITVTCSSENTFLIIFAIRLEVTGVSSDGFITAVLPAAIAPISGDIESKKG